MQYSILLSCEKRFRNDGWLPWPFRGQAKLGSDLGKRKFTWIAAEPWAEPLEAGQVRCIQLRFQIFERNLQDRDGPLPVKVSIQCSNTRSAIGAAMSLAASIGRCVCCLRVYQPVAWSVRRQESA